MLFEHERAIIVFFVIDTPPVFLLINTTLPSLPEKGISLVLPSTAAEKLTLSVNVNSASIP